MKENDKSEKFFRELASLYAEKEGYEFKNENENLEKEASFVFPSGLDRRIKNKIAFLKIRRLSYIITPVAACLLAVFISHGIKNIRMDSPGTNSEEINSAETGSTHVKNIELLSAKLPSSYTISKTEQDKEKTIVYLVTNTDNNIVLTMEEISADSKILADELKEISIGKDISAYILVKNDFSFLTYENDGILYTLTSVYNYKDLIYLSESITSL